MSVFALTALDIVAACCAAVAAVVAAIAPETLFIIPTMGIMLAMLLALFNIPIPPVGFFLGDAAVHQVVTLFYFGFGFDLLWHLRVAIRGRSSQRIGQLSNRLHRYRLSNGLLKQKSYTEAIRSFSEALSIFQRLTENNFANNDNRQGLADAYSDIGTAYEMLATSSRLSAPFRLQYWQAARTNYQKGVEILNDLKYRSAPLQDSPKVAKLKQNIATCDEALAKYSDF